MTYDVAIIGSGPAGYSAALYTSRAFLSTVLFSGMQPGGQLTTTTEVDNFPGFPKGILGPQLMTDMKDQVARFGTTLVSEAVTALSKTDHRTFRVSSPQGEYEAKTVIIATGASAQYLGIPGEKEFAGKGVSACATCDGFFFKGKVVVVIGGGDTAMEEATFLSKFAIKVAIVHRRDTFRASPIMLERAKKDPKITFVTNKQAREIVGESVVSGVVLEDTVTKEQMTYPTQGVFLAIGHTPNTAFSDGMVERDTKGYIVLQTPKTALDPKTATSQEGIFAAGDCVDPRYRQAIVAAGSGAMAALDAQKYLEEHA